MPGVIDAGDRSEPTAWSRLWAVLAVAALLWVLAARMLGPSDAWDQTQPTTIGYTTDMLVNGRWVVPADRPGKPATKPPLYNWLAAPAVAAASYSSEVAHKLPSVAAMVLCFVVVVVFGQRVIPGAHTSGAGWLAGLVLVSNYTIFKTGYLARPDMLLVLWMFAGWAAATMLMVTSRPWLALTFWLCVGLAALTKGPAALPLVFYALVAPKLVAGRWGATRVFRWSWGPAVALAGIAAWLYAVWRIAPEHLVGELWLREIVGQVTGIGPSQREPIALLTTAPNMLWYFLSRFAPWCVVVIMAMRRLRNRGGIVLYGAAIFVVVMIATYTLVASKRADYLAPAYPPSALLAAWWLLQGPPWRRWLPVVCAPMVLVALTVHNRLEPAAPFRGFGNTISEFVSEAETHIEADPAPVVCWLTGFTHMESFMGYTGDIDEHAVAEAVATSRPFWLVVGRWGPMTPEQRLQHFGIDVTVTEACRSRLAPYSKYWPLEVVLYRAEPLTSDQ